MKHAQDQDQLTYHPQDEKLKSVRTIMREIIEFFINNLEFSSSLFSLRYSAYIYCNSCEVKFDSIYFYGTSYMVLENLG